MMLAGLYSLLQSQGENLFSLVSRFHMPAHCLAHGPFTFRPVIGTQASRVPLPSRHSNLYPPFPSALYENPCDHSEATLLIWHNFPI